MPRKAPSSNASTISSKSATSSTSMTAKKKKAKKPRKAPRNTTREEAESLALKLAAKSTVRSKASMAASDRVAAALYATLPTASAAAAAAAAAAGATLSAPPPPVPHCTTRAEAEAIAKRLPPSKDSHTRKQEFTLTSDGVTLSLHPCHDLGTPTTTSADPQPASSRAEAKKRQAVGLPPKGITQEEAAALAERVTALMADPTLSKFDMAFGSEGVAKSFRPPSPPPGAKSSAAQPATAVKRAPHCTTREEAERMAAALNAKGPVSAKSEKLKFTLGSSGVQQSLMSPSKPGSDGSTGSPAHHLPRGMTAEEARMWSRRLVRTMKSPRVAREEFTLKSRGVTGALVQPQVATTEETRTSPRKLPSRLTKEEAEALSRQIPDAPPAKACRQRFALNSDGVSATLVDPEPLYADDDDDVCDYDNDNDNDNGNDGARFGNSGVAMDLNPSDPRAAMSSGLDDDNLNMAHGKGFTHAEVEEKKEDDDSRLPLPVQPMDKPPSPRRKGAPVAPGSEALTRRLSQDDAFQHEDRDLAPTLDLSEGSTVARSRATDLASSDVFSPAHWAEHNSSPPNRSKALRKSAAGAPTVATAAASPRSRHTDMASSDVFSPAHWVEHNTSPPNRSKALRKAATPTASAPARRPVGAPAAGPPLVSPRMRHHNMMASHFSLG